MSEREPSPAALIERAARLGVRIALAESLTGGLLAATIVSMPGASSVLSGGVVAYDTALKHSLLGVDAALLRSRGPVDGEVAIQMARGVRAACAIPAGGDDPGAASEGEPPQLLPADIGVATTGVAGPDPDPQSGQPAGTVWLGISSAAGERAIRLQLEGDRTAIREESVRAALRALGEELEGHGSSSPMRGGAATR